MNHRLCTKFSLFSSRRHKFELTGTYLICYLTYIFFLSYYVKWKVCVIKLKNTILSSLFILNSEWLLLNLFILIFLFPISVQFLKIIKKSMNTLQFFYVDRFCFINCMFRLLYTFFYLWVEFFINKFLKTNCAWIDSSLFVWKKYIL